MYLNEKECQHYYCTQARGGGGTYFQGIRYQRGGGFFQNIFRSVSPLMIKVGKYFGKKLLKAGGNVMSDIASGSSLKDSARARFREESKNIKDDLFQKLQQQSGEGIKKKRRKKSAQSSFARRRTNNARKKRKKNNSRSQSASKHRKISFQHHRDIFS